MVAAAIVDAVHSVHKISDAGLTPHSPARLIFKGLPRATMIRQIKAPHPIPAILPHVSLQFLPEQPEAVAELYANTDDNYALLTQQTTAVLLDLMGVEEGTGAKLAACNGGPRLVWKNAASPKASDRARTNPVSRAWDKTVTWLRDLAANRNLTTAKAAKWNLLHYRHNLTVDDPYLQADASSFRAWVRCISDEALSSPMWIKTFLAVATKEAEHASNKAARLATTKFPDWLKDGPPRD